MKNEINNSEEKNNIKNKNQTPENIIKPISSEKGVENTSKMMSIKNMFNLNADNNKDGNHSNNSFYKKSNIQNNSLIPRTFSNCHLNKEHLNNKNFPSKADFCKGNLELAKKYKYENSSPIFQYYASNQTNNNFLNGRKGQDLCSGSSLENPNSLGFSGGRESPGFNYSPSQIFNKNGSIKSGFIRVPSEINVGVPFSIDGEADEGGVKNLDFKLPTDDLYNIEFYDENFDINFAEDKNSIVNKINEIKKNKKDMNDAVGLNNNINHYMIGNINKNEEINKNLNLNNNNNLIIEIIESENENKNKDTKNVKKSNLPIKKVMEKLIKKKKENGESSNNKPNINQINNEKVQNINIINIPQETNKKVITKNVKTVSGEINQNISPEFKIKIEADLDRLDNDHIFENKKTENIEEESEKSEDDYNSEDKDINANLSDMKEINLNNMNKIKDIKEDEKIINNMSIDKLKYNKDLNNNKGNIFNNNLNMKNKEFNNLNDYYVNYNGINNNNSDNIYNNTFNNNYNNYFYKNNYNFNNNGFNNNFNDYNSYPQEIYNLGNNTGNQAFYFPQNNYKKNKPLNMINNDIFNNNNNYYQIPQNLLYNNDSLNNIQKYNQLLQNSGNINIQNNYFMYNNQGNLNNNLNMKEIKEIPINKKEENQKEKTANEKPKKKRRKKQKRLDSSSYINKPLSYFADNFITMAKDQGASRYLQQLLENNPKELIDTLFIPLCKNALKLINDPFGNYLIQKLITYFNQDQMLKLLTIISPSFYEISCNSHGTRVLQKMIGLLSSPIIKNYFYELVKPIVAPLLKDLNGTYIVQKFATKYLTEYGLKINAIIIENSSELCTHRHGCCVIQKYLETKDQTMIPALLDKLIEDSLLLIVDQFGNYVIQTILLMGDKKYGNKLAEKISPNIVFYAKHKYSSNVVEKCFDYCNGIYLKNLMNNVQKKENLTKLILDEHGNYVVQKALSLSSPKKQKSMLGTIKTLFDKLKTLPFGERVISRIVSTYPFINNI